MDLGRLGRTRLGDGIWGIGGGSVSRGPGEGKGCRSLSLSSWAEVPNAGVRPPKEQGRGVQTEGSEGPQG